MRSRAELARYLLNDAYRQLHDNLPELTLGEALRVPQGGYRSVLGILKHTAGWSHVYRSFAFDPAPTSWFDLDFPRGLRDMIEPTREYLDDVLGWLTQSHHLWMQSLATVTDEQLDEQRPVHWGATKPLFDIVTLIVTHHVYHAGELNILLSIYRGEAWEEGEEVEENLISTIGHRVEMPWSEW